MAGNDLLCGHCCYAGTTLCGYYTDEHGSWLLLNHDEQGRAVRNNPCLVKGRPLGSCMLDEHRTRIEEIFGAAAKQAYDSGLPVSSCPTCRPRIPPRRDD